VDLEARFPRIARSACEARTFVADALTADGLDADPDTVLLLTSELVTNAVEHGEGEEIAVRVRRHGDQVRVEVADRCPLMPRQRQAGVLDEHGRGIALVAALAHDWGAHIVHSTRRITKVVWFAVRDERLADLS
jgi:anti-sigma regulatory factor (Ser/Thr protein kinase)